MVVAGGHAPLATGGQGVMDATAVGHREQAVVAVAVHNDGSQSQQVVTENDGLAHQIVFEGMGGLALRHVDGQMHGCGFEQLILVKQRLHELVVEGVEFVAIVAGASVDDNDQVQLGHHIDELAAVAGRKVALGPRVLDGLGLVSVAQVVIIDVIAREPRAYGVPHAAQGIHQPLGPGQLDVTLLLGADQALCHVVDPLGTDELLAVPLALLQHELSQFGLALGMQAQTPSAYLDAVGSEFPVALGDVQRHEDAFPHIVEQRLAREPRDNHRQGMGTHRVIVEYLAHAMEIAGKPGTQPVLVALKDAQVLFASRRHHEHVAHGEAIQGGRQRGRHLVAQVF